MSAVETGIALDSFSPSESDSETYLARYDRTETPASMAVVAVISKALGRDPVEMDQLYYAIDAEALDELIDEGDVGAAVSVTFAYEGYEVTVTAGEVVAVRPAAGAQTDARGGESAAT
ncbi:MAG: HalOD1 output domain-containing protein [Natrialbaceae archaeon]